MVNEYAVMFKRANPQRVWADNETEARKIAGEICDQPIVALKLLERECVIDLENPPLNAMLTPEECAVWLRKENKRQVLQCRRIPKHKVGATVLYHVGTVLAAIGPTRKSKTG